MHEHLVGYICGALDGEEHLAVEEKLGVDQEVRRSLEKLRSFLAPLECDREDCCPPEGLAARVCNVMKNQSGRPPAEGFA
jgi:hypothetical protein